MELSFEELQSIENNEYESQIAAQKIDENFKILLDSHLTHELNLDYKTHFVPSDGSCLYHAILESFHEKYLYALELDHRNMRKKVAVYLLEHANNPEFLKTFADEEAIVGILDEVLLKNKYITYCNRHKIDTTNWPHAMCIHAVTKIYWFQITVLAENLLENSVGVGTIFTRLQTEPESVEFQSILIGNRWNQHYYSIGNNIFKNMYYNNINFLNKFSLILVPSEAYLKLEKKRKRKEAKKEDQHKYYLKNASTTSPEKMQEIRDRNREKQRKRRAHLKLLSTSLPSSLDERSVALIEKNMMAKQRESAQKKTKWLPIQQEWDELNPCG